MEIKEEKGGNVKIVGLHGKLDASASPIVEEALMRLLDGGERQLVLDFSNVDFISSLGLRVLVATAKYMQKNKGKLAIAALTKHVYDVFQIAGFTRIFSVYSTCDEAVAHTQSAEPV